MSNFDTLIKDLEARLGTEKKPFSFSDKQKKGIVEAFERLPQNQVYLANGVQPHLLDQLEGLSNAKDGTAVADAIKGLHGKLPKGVPSQYKDAIEPVLKKLFAVDQAIETKLGAKAEALELIDKAFGEPKDVEALGNSLSKVEEAIFNFEKGAGRNISQHQQKVVEEARAIIGDAKAGSGLYAKLTALEAELETAGESKTAINRVGRSVSDLATGLKRQVADEGMEALKATREELFEALKTNKLGDITSKLGKIEGLEAITEAEAKAFATTSKALGAEMSVDGLVEQAAKASGSRGAFTDAGKAASEGAKHADGASWLAKTFTKPVNKEGQEVTKLFSKEAKTALRGGRLAVAGAAVAIGASLMMNGKNKEKFESFDQGQARA